MATKPKAKPAAKEKAARRPRVVKPLKTAVADLPEEEYRKVAPQIVADAVVRAVCAVKPLNEAVFADEHRVVIDHLINSVPTTTIAPTTLRITMTHATNWLATERVHEFASRLVPTLGGRAVLNRADGVVDDEPVAYTCLRFDGPVDPEVGARVQDAAEAALGGLDGVSFTWEGA